MLSCQITLERRSVLLLRPQKRQSIKACVQVETGGVFIGDLQRLCPPSAAIDKHPLRRPLRYKSTLA